MFRFKKSVQGVSKEEGFECECCGPMEGAVQNGSNGCLPCGLPVDKSGCGCPTGQSETQSSSCCGSGTGKSCC